MWIPPQSTLKKPLEVNQYVGDKSLKKRAYVKIEEWEPHREFVLRQRHAKVKEKDILHALRHERGFVVEMHQLKKVLQLWNSKRNLKRKQRDYIVQVVKERRRAGKSQTIFYHPGGTLIDLPEVKEIMRRYGNSEPLEPPSPGGLIYGSPRLRTTPPEILYDAREISPNDSDLYGMSLSNDTTSPESLTSLQSPIVVTGAEYANTTASYTDIDVFLYQQTTGQSLPNMTIPTTAGYQSSVSPGTMYRNLGFGEDLSIPAGYSAARPIVISPDIDPALERELSRPIPPAMPPASITSGYMPTSSAPGFFTGPPAPPVHFPPTSGPFNYPAPPKHARRQNFPPPTPMMQPPAPPPMMGQPAQPQMMKPPAQPQMMMPPVPPPMMQPPAPPPMMMPPAPPPMMMPPAQPPMMMPPVPPPMMQPPAQPPMMQPPIPPPMIQPPAPPPSMQSSAPAPPPAPPKSKGFSFFPRFGFQSSKKSSQPAMAPGSSMVQPGGPALYSGAPAGEATSFSTPQSAQGPPPLPASVGIAPPGLTAGPSPLLPSDNKPSRNEDVQAPKFKAPAPHRPTARRPSRKEPYIKEEFPEISTLDYSRSDSRKGKDAKREDDSKALREMAERARKLLSGIPPADESIKRAKRKTGEESTRRAEEEAMRRMAEEQQAERQLAELFAQEQTKLRVEAEARMKQEEEREEAKRRAFHKDSVQAMEVDEDDAEWTEDSEPDEWQQDSGRILKQELDEDVWPGKEETDSSWHLSSLDQPFDFEHQKTREDNDFEQQRLQETFERVAPKFRLIQPRARYVVPDNGSKIEPSRHAISANTEPEPREPKQQRGTKDHFLIEVSDTWKIKRREIENPPDLGDLLTRPKVSDKQDKEKKPDKDLVDAFEGLKVSAGKKDIEEKWGDDEEDDKWGEKEEDDKWGEEEEDDKWGEEEENDKWEGNGPDVASAETANPKMPKEPAESPPDAKKFSIKPTTSNKPIARSVNYVPFKKLISIEYEFQEFIEVEFGHRDMERVYRLHLQDWFKTKIDDVEEELEIRRTVQKKGDGKVFLADAKSQPFPYLIQKATKDLAKVEIDPASTEAEVQYEKELWRWVLQRRWKIISYMKETLDMDWTRLWDKTEQAIVYFLPFLGERFGTKHWFTLEGIKILGESYLWEKIEDGWKDGLMLRNVAYKGFADLDLGKTELAFQCLDDGVVEREAGKGRRKMELRRAVQHYRIVISEFGDWSEPGVYALAKMIRALAKIDKERTKHLVHIAAAGFLKIPKEFLRKTGVANSIWMIGEAMKDTRMATAAVGFMLEMMPVVKQISDKKADLPTGRTIGCIADGFEALGLVVAAIEWRGRTLRIVSEALGRRHPETILWTKRVQRGLEARGVQFLDQPGLTTVEWITRRVFWEGQRRGVDQRRLLKSTRKIAESNRSHR